MRPAPALVDRFRRDLGALVAPDARIGAAVSGGPDSLALLLLLAAERPGQVEAATVDHALRDGSRAEAEMVAALCERLGVPHTILTAIWTETPRTAVQERARAVRYERLSDWVEARGLDALATGHQLDDQAETLVMRLGRGAGVRGLAAMRARSLVPGSDLALIRPLLGWHRSELAELCADAEVEPACDPSNDDAAFERVRLRKALADTPWLDPQALAASAAHLGEADSALDWAARHEWAAKVTNGGAAICYRPGDAPPEIRRRILSEAVRRLGAEGDLAALRGGELDRLLAALEGGGQATLRGVLFAGGSEWRFSKSPPRKA